MNETLSINTTLLGWCSSKNLLGDSVPVYIGAWGIESHSNRWDSRERSRDRYLKVIGPGVYYSLRLYMGGGFGSTIRWVAGAHETLNNV
jgi:hypothetical protein